MARCMAVGAHPDDIEIGVGGTLRKLIRDGHEVVCVDLTDGEPTPNGDRQTRPRETAAANAILGVTERVCLGLPNRVLMDNEDGRRRLATVMRQYRPELIFTHVGHDAHPDHVAAADLTRGAVLLSRIVKIDLPHEPWRPGPVYHFLCSHLRYLYQPSFLLAVSPEDFEAKLDAILAYESQFVTGRPNFDIRTYLGDRMRYWGAMGRTEYAEAFIAEEPLCLSDLMALG